MNEFGEYLRELRGKKSLRKVSDEAGISHTYLSTLEKGYDPRTKKTRKPNPEVLKKLASYYRIPYTQLLERAGYLEEGTFQKRLDLMKKANESINKPEQIEARNKMEEQWRKENNYIELTEVFSDKTTLAIDGNLLISNGKLITSKEKEEILEIIKAYLS